MAINADSIQDPTSTVPANSEEAPKDTSGIPEEVLEIPIMRGILEGAPPAVFAPVGTKSPEIATVLKHGKELLAAGLGFYRDEKNKLDVFFNTRFIQPELVEAAAKKNKIPEIASPLLETMAQFNDAAGIPTTSAASPSAAQVGTSGTTMPDTPVNTARLNNLEPGSPTEGPRPGAGRILNNLIKPVI